MLKLYYGHIQLVEDQKVFDRWFEKMDATRKDKVLRCKQEGDRRRSLLAGILLHYGVESNREAKQIYYSISHSGDYVICAIADRRVGVDVENQYRSVFLEGNEAMMDKIAQKSLTMGEEIQYLSTDEDKRRDLLLQYWTKKESYSKALGKGLALDFATIDTQKMDQLYWSGWLEKGYYCSLYVENGVFNDMKLQEIITL